ncbi:hypothetical protein [Haloplanus aerogenes]|uniref:Uncharacterized protein n=1 Tax=Haloplanus aerogenes TaxID=660522 RepID=A0A3M0D9S5_9EURY|nr:hypothetical protein [Haloplanus aerogenes]AZH26431.1 hypothetical protein DU502_14105 [Haloplanus aerogenes]RMB18105.1 hypothetical protein ATH50_1552 [Haloplanus aerogenes]
MRTQVGHVLIGIACALFVGGAVGLFLGIVGADAVTPLGVAALACLAVGGAFSLPHDSND